MSISMSLDNYEIEHDSMEAKYGDDILYAGWNPAVDSVHQQLQIEQTTEQQNTPSAPAKEIEELFLRRMYSFQG